MALVYKRSDSKATRAYERSSGMEPNPGVNALTVVSNPRRTSRRRVSENPFQWIEGRGQRHQHVSPEYETLKGASSWKKRNPRSDARLYPVDKRGTIVSRPVSKKLLDNGGTEMAYNIGALRRAMRSNPRGRRVSVRENETPGGVKVSSRKRRTTKNKRRTTKRRKTTANRRRAPRRNSRRTSRRAPKRNSRRRSRKKTTANRRRSRRSRAPKRNSRRRSRAPRRNSRRRRSRAPRRNSRRTSKRRTSKRRSSRRSSRRPRRNATKRGGKRRTSRRAKYWNGRRVSSKRGREYLDKYLSKGYMPTTAPRYRTGKSRSGIPPVLVYPIARGQGRLKSRKTRRTSKSRSPNRRSTKARSLGASYGGSRKRRMAANRRRSRRTSRRASVRPNRRRSRRRTTKNRRRSRRASVRPNRRRSRRTSKRRSSRRRRSRRPVRKNLLSTSKVRWGRSGKTRTGRPVGGTYQVLAYGPGSRTRTGSKLKGYPVYVPGHVISTAAVRKYRGLGGAAKDSHRRAKRRGYRERRKYPRRRVTRNTRRTSMRRNRRKSTRRRSTRRNSRRRRTRRNPKYVVANRRRRSSKRRSSRRRVSRNRGRRRVRRNAGFFGADLMQDVLIPVAGATGGFVGARVLSNGLANVGAIRNILDKDKPAAEANNTKIAANLLGIVATLGLSSRVAIIKRNRGALIAGMGLALTDRLLGKVQGEAAQYLSGFGEYVSQPLGEYVSQPLGGFGEYVDQPLGETLYAAAGMGAMQAAAGYAEGVDPANQAGVDQQMDVMEAAAGMGTMYATAGMGDTLYAAAGLGAESDASLKSMYAREQPPFASIQTPTDLARPVSRTMPYARQVPDTLVTPEGRGYAGGLFSRNLFAGML